MANLKEIILEVDSSLELVEGFEDRGYNVGKVKKEGSFYIFKYGFWTSENSFIRREIKALNLAKDVSGITHLVEDYGKQEGCHAILKDYAPGKDLELLKKNISNKNIKEKLEQTIRDLHYFGIVDLDIWPKNIVLSADEKDVKIIDLDCCKFRCDYGSKMEFEEAQKEDLKNLEDCFI